MSSTNSDKTRIGRNRPPRVHISYDVEAADAVERVELPFVLGILADLKGDTVYQKPAPGAGKPDLTLLRDRPFVEIDRDSFDDIMGTLAPSLNLTGLTVSGVAKRQDVHLTFKTMADFHPTQVARQIPALAALLVERQKLRDLAAPTPGDEQRSNAIDAQLSAYLNAVLHEPKFKALEAHWRGLYYLVADTETGSRIKLRLLDVTRAELQADLDNAAAFAQSALFKKVYTDVYGVVGALPYSALLGDFGAFGGQPDDLKLLAAIANVAAAAQAPFIAAAAPGLFDLDSFTQLDAPKAPTLAHWRAFRASETAHYVTLTLPQVRLRLPYGPTTVAVAAFNFVETAAKEADFLWGSSAWFFAQRLTNAFALYGWTAAIQGIAGGGLVSNLPRHQDKTAAGTKVTRSPVDVAITDRRASELNALGFAVLCYHPDSAAAAFWGEPDTAAPNTPAQQAQSAVSLPYLLNAVRFAHYLKVMMRDGSDSLMTAQNVAERLNLWLGQYVLLSDEGGQTVLRADYPLREGRVTIVPDPSRPGRLQATLFLRPAFQLAKRPDAIQLSIDFEAPAGA